MFHFPALAACWDGVGLLPFSALIYDWKRRMRTPPNPKAKVFQIYYYYFPFFPLYHPHLSSHSFILLIYPFHTRIANKDSSPFHAAHLLIQRVPSPSTLLIFLLFYPQIRKLAFASYFIPLTSFPSLKILPFFYIHVMIKY